MKIYLILILFTISYKNGFSQNRKCYFAIGGNVLLNSSTNNLLKKNFTSNFTSNLNLNLILLNKIQLGIGKANNFAYDQNLNSMLYYKVRYYINKLDTNKLKLIPYAEFNYHTLLYGVNNQIIGSNSKMYDIGIGSLFKISTKVSIDFSILYQYSFAYKVYISTGIHNEDIESNNLAFRLGVLYQLFKLK